MLTLLLVTLVGAAPSADPVNRLRSWVGASTTEPAGYDVTADCTGPRGPYRTRVAFRRFDLWARFVQWHGQEQTWDAVVLGNQSWVVDEAGKWAAGDNETLAGVMGHQFFAMVLAPEKMFRGLALFQKEQFEGEQVEWFTGTDIAGTPVELALDATGRPVALRLQRGGKIGTLVIRWSNWQRVGKLRIPMAAQIDQGKDKFRFRFRTPQLGLPADAGWTPPDVKR